MRHFIKQVAYNLFPSIGLSLLFFSSIAFSHGGGLDSYGCHHNRKAGGYHCHRGPFAGQSFSSKEEMLQKLQETQKAKEQKEIKRK